jgi:hypothetical protein
MENEKMADTPQEGLNPFEESENDNSEDSPNEKNETEDTQSPDGDNNQDDNKKPLKFNEHPAWQRREKEWKERFDKQEFRHQDDIKSLREEFSANRKDNAEQSIPSWFGGSDEQWKSYQEHEEKRIKDAEERAFQRLNSVKSAEDKAVKEATEYMQNELSEIEKDKELNPTGSKIDQNKFIRFVLDNKFVDIETGKWDYRRAWKFYQPLKSNFGKDDRKELAGLLTSESKGENKPNAYKTSKDFKSSRPW